MRDDSGRRSPWRPGGRALLLTVILPAVVAAFGLLALVDAVLDLQAPGAIGPGPVAFCSALAALSAWTCWRLVRTPGVEIDRYAGR